MSIVPIITLSNGKDSSTVTLMEMMGNKVALKTTKEDVQKGKENMGKQQVKITDERKDIAGYKCTKAIVTTTMNNVSQVHYVWFTKDIEAKNLATDQIDGIDGFMMQYDLPVPGTKMTLTVQSVKAQKVDDSLFKVPDGYKEISMEDMMKMQGGMGK